MPRSKEISDELRKKIVEAHEAGKGYKTISKVFDVHRSTVRQIIYRWKVFNTTATRPRSGRPTKLDLILREVRKSGAGTQNGSVPIKDGGNNRAKGEESERNSGNENETEYSDGVSDSSEEEESLQISDSRPERPNVPVHTRVEDNVLPSTKPVPRADPGVTRTHLKRTRGGKEKAKNSEPMRNRVPGSAGHHVEVILCCEICGACFPTETDLENHQAQHLDKMLHECEECGKTFQSAAGLKTHKTRKHDC